MDLSRPCICGHYKTVHHTRTFLNEQENWDFEDECFGCEDLGKCRGYYQAIGNLEWLEIKAQEKVS